MIPHRNDSAEGTYTQRFHVSYEYPVHFTRRVFDPDNPLFARVVDRLGEKRVHRVLACIDSGVAEAHPDLESDIKAYFHARPDMLELAGQPIVIPGGERAKNGWEAVRDLIWTIANLHLCRHSFVLAVGGGSVLDMVGFAASLVHRGLRLVRMPTTVLAQNDAGVGVKTGMNEHGAKNFLGTFSPPFAVINDFSFLPTLPEEHWLGGVAEAFKVAIIKDAQFFAFLSAHASRFRGRDLPAMERLVRRCAELHLDHIRTSGDPFEFGAARPLDFGHWAAHQIEAMSGYTCPHGIAVSIGIAIDSFYALRKGLLTEDEFHRIIRGLTASGLPVWHEVLERRTPGGLEILEGLHRFKEHLGGVLTVTLPRGIGRMCEVHAVDAGIVEEAVEELKRIHIGPGQDDHASPA